MKKGDLVRWVCPSRMGIITKFEEHYWGWQVTVVWSDGYTCTYPLDMFAKNMEVICK